MVKKIALTKTALSWSANFVIIFAAFLQCLQKLSWIPQAVFCFPSSD